MVNGKACLKRERVKKLIIKISCGIRGELIIKGIYKHFREENGVSGCVIIFMVVIFALAVFFVNLRQFGIGGVFLVILAICIIWSVVSHDIHKRNKEEAANRFHSKYSEYLHDGDSNKEDDHNKNGKIDL